MAKTRHMQQRMAQRDIKERLLEITHRFGKTITRGNVCKTILNRQGIDQTMKVIESLQRDLNKARKQGGLVVISTADGVDITTYHMNSYRRPSPSTYS